MVLVYSLVAYAVAIALKYAVQLPTINIVINNFGAHSVALGFYYGLQTVFFEVGLAFVVAWYAFKHGQLRRKMLKATVQGWLSGKTLVFWNSIAHQPRCLLWYSLVKHNSCQTLYNQLQTNAPDLFLPASQALGSVAIGTLERISSIMLHFAWGYLCVMAVVYNKKRLFLILCLWGSLISLYLSQTQITFFFSKD